MRWLFNRRSADVIDTLEPQEAYSLWARSYPPAPHNALMEIEQQTIFALLPEVSGLTVLDAGCGTGRYLRALKQRGAFAVGVDLSTAMLSRARQLTRHIARADLRALPFEAMSIDLVLCGLALGDFAELDVALAEIARVLRPFGCVIYSVVHPAGEARSWSRTFESEGRTLAIKSFWHSIDRHREVCASAGLSIDRWCEPAVTQAPGERALLVVRARR